MGDKRLQPKSIANLAQVLEMILLYATLDKDVVKVDDEKFYDERMQYLIHEPQKRARGVRDDQMA